MIHHLRRGVLITLEGGEGSGKSSQAEALAKLLRDDGYSVLLTGEPGGTGLGRLIKEIFERLALPGETLLVSPAAEMLLFEAARAQHVEEVIRPALERGEVVLCDRYTDSTLAYQGRGRGLGLDHIRACNYIATGGLAPDLTFLLDVPPEVGLARADKGPPEQRERSKDRDVIGQEPLEFHRLVRQGFLELAQREPQRIAVLDASLPFSAVTEAAWRRLRDFLQHVL